MTDREAFLRAIGESPEDDRVRLIFADWLEERGEAERAEFIRLQCDLERQGCKGPLTLSIAMMTGGLLDAPGSIRRVAELLHRNGPVWLGNLLFDIPIRDIREWEWSRGFVHTVRGPLDALRKHLPAMGAELLAVETATFIEHLHRSGAGRGERWWLPQTLRDGFVRDGLFLNEGWPTEAAARAALSAMILAESRGRAGLAARIGGKAKRS